MAIPALGLGLLGAAQHSLFGGNREEGLPNYYQARASGNKEMYNPFPTTKVQND